MHVSALDCSHSWSYLLMGPRPASARYGGVLDTGLSNRSGCPRTATVCRTLKGACMDDLVASAIAHWAPRFTTNGVTVSDFQRVTGRVERWADWCAAWSEMGAEHEALGRR